LNEALRKLTPQPKYSSIGWKLDRCRQSQQISQKLVATGVDIITVNADTAYKGVIKVVAENKGVYAIRWNHAIPGLPEQQKPPPKMILTNAMQQVPMVMLEGATLVQQGRWEGKQYKFGLQEEIQDLTPFYGSLTPEQEEFDKLAQGRHHYWKNRCYALVISHYLNLKELVGERDF
jgi:basic membrane lipoprotein Med (substrate-binding protein (PBP1-ABC) superfamily)